MPSLSGLQMKTGASRPVRSATGCIREEPLWETMSNTARRGRGVTWSVRSVDTLPPLGRRWSGTSHFTTKSRTRWYTHTHTPAHKQSESLEHQWSISQFPHVVVILCILFIFYKSLHSLKLITCSCHPRVPSVWTKAWRRGSSNVWSVGKHSSTNTTSKSIFASTVVSYKIRSKHLHSPFISPLFPLNC